MSSSASLDAYDTHISLRNKLTHLNSVIMPEAVDKLEDELGGIFTVTKTHHYDQGQKYGHLEIAIPKSKYRLVIGDATWNHTAPINPGAYSADALAADNAAVTPEQFVVRGATQDRTEKLHGLPERQRGGQGTHPVRRRRRCSGATQEAVHWIWQHNRPPDRPPTPQDGHQDDDRRKIRVQDERKQHSVRSHNKHHRVLHAARSFPCVTDQEKNDGSGRSNVAV